MSSVVLKKIPSIVFYTVPLAAFSHIEAMFVFGIMHDCKTFSEKYVLSLSLVGSKFIFDALVVFFPLLFLGAILEKKINKPESFAASYLCALLFTVRFSSVIYNKSFLLLAIISSISFLLCYRSFEHVMGDNNMGLLTTSLIASAFYFYTQKISFSQVLFGYFGGRFPLTLCFIADTAAIFALILSAAWACRLFTKKIALYFYALFLLMVICEWGVFYTRSDRYLYNDAYVHSGQDVGRPNIMLIVLDTFRADNISPFLTPTLEAFAKECVVYENCVSTSPWTLPAHASIFTGLYPTSHGAHFLESSKHLSAKHKFTKIDEDSYPLASQNLTMAEILGSAGYKCYGVVANYGYMNHKTGIAQGFSYYDDRRNLPFYYMPFEEKLYSFPIVSYFVKKISVFSGLHEQKLHHNVKSSRQAEDINKSVRHTLNNHIKDKPFFMFVNYMDTHAPYIPRKAYRERFASMIKDEWLKPHIPGWEELMTNNRKVTKKEKEHITAAYRGEVAYLDKQIGILFAYLKEVNLYNNTLIVLTADHGEFLGEHNLIGHGFGLYKEVLHVPLLIKYPGDMPGTKSKQNVQLVDILPTVLNSIKVKTPSAAEGQTLYKTKIPKRYMVSELYENASCYKLGTRFRGISRAMYNLPYKYIANSARKNELYNIISDPKEHNNLLSSKPHIAKTMNKALSKWVKQRKPRASKTRKLNREELKNLKSLGYLF